MPLLSSQILENPELKANWVPFEQSYNGYFMELSNIAKDIYNKERETNSIKFKKNALNIIRVGEYFHQDIFNKITNVFCLLITMSEIIFKPAFWAGESGIIETMVRAGSFAW
jgi:hypothetical protein